MSNQELPIPNDWDEPTDGFINVVLCIPNSQMWRGMVSGAIYRLTRGRVWDATTGTITEVQAIAKEIHNTMSMCNLEVELARVATALEGIEANQPRLYTLAELETVFGSDPTVNWEQVEAFLDVFDLLPGIKFDPLKYILEWIWRSQTLAIGYSMSTSQAAMASALAKGLAIEGIEGVLEGIDDTTDFLLQILQGGGTIATAIAALATLFKDTEQGSDIKVLNDVVVNLGDQTIAIENQISCGVCQQSTCVCNPEIDGPVVEEAAASITNCCPPDGFATFPDYETYACTVANWIADKMIIAVKQMALLHYQFFFDYSNIVEAGRMSVTQVYKRMANALSDMVNPQILFNIPNDVRSDLITNLTNRYVAFQDEVIATVPATKTLAQVIQEYWTDPFDLPANWLDTNKDTHKQQYFDSTGATDLLSDIVTNLTSAAAEALGWSVATVEDALLAMGQMGLANAKYINNTAIGSYVGDYVCTGTLCTCTRETVRQGIDNGGFNYSSVFTGGWDQVQVSYYLDTPSPDVFCGPEVRTQGLELQGYQATGVGNDFQVVRQNGSFAYQGNTMWPSSTVGATFLIRSNGAFSVTYLAEEEC